MGQNQWETVEDDDQKDAAPVSDYSWKENSTSDKENNNQTQPVESKDDMPSSAALHFSTLNAVEDDVAQGDTSDEGWQEAVPKSRSLSSRKSSGSRRPSLAKLNTNAINNGDSARYRGRSSPSFSPSRTSSPNEAVPASSAPSSISKKLLKSSSFSPKPATPTAVSSGNIEKSSVIKSASSSPAPSPSSVSVPSTRKNLSYKEVALAPPGTIVKAVEEQVPKESAAEEPTPTQQIVVNPPDVEKTDTLTTEEDKDSKHVIPEKGDSDTKNITVTEVQSPKTENVTSCENVVATVECNIKEESKEVSSVVEYAEIAKKTENEGKESEPASSASEEPTSDSVEEGSKLGNGTSEQMSSEVETAKPPLLVQGEKQEAVEIAKEPSKKLSASAPPFNPSMIPVFSSVIVPAFKEHGGILPPPLNTPPMPVLHPVRKTPHQSATARVPYGPRLSSGYNRSGNRVPRNKPGFQNGDITIVDANCFSPRIMNPNAAEFVPGQPWSPNGHPVSPNGQPGSPNAVSPSPHSCPESPSSFAASLPTSVPVEACEATQVSVQDDDDIEKPSKEMKDENKAEQVEQAEQIKDAELENDCNNDSSEDNIEVSVEASEPPKVVENPSKCWADYSDGEAEIVEVSS